MRLQIRVNNLKVSYGKNIALEIPSLNAEGKIIAVIGHNGSGKSTLIKNDTRPAHSKSWRASY